MGNFSKPISALSRRKMENQIRNPQFQSGKLPTFLPAHAPLPIHRLPESDCSRILWTARGKLPRCGMAIVPQFVTQLDFNAAMIRLQADNIALREVIKILLQEEQTIQVNAENLEQVLGEIAALRLQDGLVGIENVDPALAATLQQAIDGVETVDATAPPLGN
jgi:hypothetical protein